MNFSIGVELPDFLDSSMVVGVAPDVEVMTPERLGYLLRQDAAAVVERFTLFMFDEAHTVADETRGWTLESVLTYLHAQTLNSAHRIVLMSAALGNRGHFVSWLSGEDLEPAEHHHDWRGPRRLHCIWAPAPDRGQETKEMRRSTQFPVRLRYPLHGYLHIRTTHDGGFQTLHTEEVIGELVLKEDRYGTRTRDDGTTPKYQLLLPLIDFLTEAGPVLVIEASKDATARLASAVADTREINESPETAAVREFVASRLGEVPRNSGASQASLSRVISDLKCLVVGKRKLASRARIADPSLRLTSPTSLPNVASN
jgi:hypothetical protein